MTQYEHSSCIKERKSRNKKTSKRRIFTFPRALFCRSQNFPYECLGKNKKKKERETQEENAAAVLSYASKAPIYKYLYVQSYRQKGGLLVQKEGKWKKIPSKQTADRRTLTLSIKRRKNKEVLRQDTTPHELSVIRLF